MRPVEQIRKIANQGKPDISPYKNCGFINRKIAQELEEQGVETNIIEGGFWQSRSKREEHLYVEIPASHVEGTSYPVIVDGAAKQFCEENTPDVWVNLGERKEIPAIVVATRGHKWYNCYQPQTP